jgi:hypothetical protein
MRIGIPWEKTSNHDWLERMHAAEVQVVARLKKQGITNIIFN